MDKRRKLAPSDYPRIRQKVNREGETIREVAHEFGISTKYVKKILTNQAPQDWNRERWVKIMTGEPIIVSASGGTIHALQASGVYICSGCHRLFTDKDDIWWHINIWTSGGTRDLDCWKLEPGRFT